MMPLEDFLRDTIGNDVDEAIQQQYFLLFRYQFQFCPPDAWNDRGEWARDFLRHLEQENLQAYRNQWISPKGYSYLLFIWKLFDLCTAPDCYDHELIEQLWANPIQVAYSQQEKKQFLARIKKELKKQAGREGVAYAEHYVWPTLKELPTLLFTALINFQQTKIIKQLISYLYFSYREKLQKLLDTSESFEQWMENIAEVIPYLLLKNFIPIHDTFLVKNPEIGIVFEALPGTPSHVADPGTVSRVSRFFRNLFTTEEIEQFEHEGQKITETFAHLYPVVLGDIVGSLEQRKAEILEVARQEGSRQGLQLAIIQYKQRLRIPKYLFEEIKVCL